MRRLATALLAVVVLASVSSRPPSAEETQAAPEPPDWARQLRLVLIGGPVASDVAITLNGQLVIVVQGKPEGFHPIADLVRPGVNELKVALDKPDARRAAGEDLVAAVHEVSETDRKIVTKGHALAEIRVPAAASSEPPCETTVRFWAGPPPGPPPTGLKNAYWLYVNGPAAHVSVGVLVNDQLVHEASSGQAGFDITPFVRKGKNAVAFELRPTCLVPDTGRSGPLVVGIGPASLRGKTVEMTEPPQAEVKIDPERDTEARVVRRSFRAW